jgi:hypothetical protein
LARVKISGTLFAKKRIGRNVYRAYFVIISDGRMIRNLVDKNSRGDYGGDGEVEFTRTLVIHAKYGPSGLEGVKTFGGLWYSIVLVPSDTYREVKLTLPLRDEEISIEIRGNFDIERTSGCSWYDTLSLINLIKQPGITSSSSA